MIPRSMRSTAAAAAFCGLLLASPAFANLLANGSFESGPDPGVAMALPGGATSVAGWVVTRAGIRYVGTAWTAAQGARSIALNGANAGGIAQTFATQPRAQYTLRLYMAGDVGTLPDIKTMSVTAAHQQANFSVDLTGMWEWDPGWDLRTWTFTADAESTTLELFSSMAGTTGPSVDSVSVVLTSTADVAPALAGGLALAPPSPNPVRGACGVAFDLPCAQRARLSVFDLAGREVAVLADGEIAAGVHRTTWNADRAAPPGLYLVSLRTAGATLTRHLVLVR